MGVDDKYIIIFQKSFKYYITKYISMKLISIFKSKLLCCSTSSLVFS